MSGSCIPPLLGAAEQVHLTSTTDIDQYHSAFLKINFLDQTDHNHFALNGTNSTQITEDIMQDSIFTFPFSACENRRQACERLSAEPFGKISVSKIFVQNNSPRAIIV